MVPFLRGMQRQAAKTVFAIFQANHVNDQALTLHQGQCGRIVHECSRMWLLDLPHAPMADTDVACPVRSTPQSQPSASEPYW